MKILLISLFFSLFASAQNSESVWIKDKEGKVIKVSNEKEYKKVIDSIGPRAKYTSRWINAKEMSCPIKWSESLKLDRV